MPDGFGSPVSPEIMFGLALPMADQTDQTSQLFAELTAEVVAAESHGFDLCLVPEHHGGPTGALSDPMLMVAWLLARTRRIVLGTGVLILPLHSLPRLAEQSCLLQHASGGRLMLGVGAGYQRADFDTFGIAMADRGALMTSGIRALKRVWRDGELDGHPIRPVLGERQAPPLLVGAWSDRGIRRTASEADGWIADPIRSVDEIATTADQYRSLAHHHDLGGRVVVMRDAWVARTDAEAVATFAPIIEPIFRYYLRNGAFPADHGLSEAELTLPGPLSERVLCGSPATMVEEISKLIARTEADTVVLGLRHPRGPEHDAVLAAIETLGREVLPAVRARLSGSRFGGGS